MYTRGEAYAIFRAGVRDVTAAGNAAEHPHANCAQFDVRDSQIQASRKRIWTDADDELLVYLNRESRLKWNQVLVYFKHSSVKDLKVRLLEFGFEQLNAIA